MKDYKNADKKLLDPDVRFLLANERTLLAWVRTGLTLQAAGFALAHFGNSLSATAAGVAAILSGGYLQLLDTTDLKRPTGLSGITNFLRLAKAQLWK